MKSKKKKSKKYQKTNVFAERHTQDSQEPTDKAHKYIQCC